MQHINVENLKAVIRDKAWHELPPVLQLKERPHFQYISQYFALTQTDGNLCLVKHYYVNLWLIALYMTARAPSNLPQRSHLVWSKSSITSWTSSMPTVMARSALATPASWQICIPWWFHWFHLLSKLYNLPNVKRVRKY